MTNHRLPIDRLPKIDPFAQKTSQDRFSEDEMGQIKQDFAKRLFEAFNAEKPAHIAQALNVPDATVSYYVKAQRLPIAEMLIQIHNKTGVSLNWLLLGKGKKYAEFDQAFSDDEREEIESMAKQSGRTFQEEVRALTISGLKAVKNYQK